MAKDKDDKDSKVVIEEALELFEESQDATDFNRTAAYDDIVFARLSEQWPDKIKKQREEEGRPCLTINRLPAFIRQIVNDSRQNKPGIVVHPVDNVADPDTAEVINGLIRNIERNSNADVAYDTAIDHAVSAGFGFFQIGIDFVNESSFEMEAQIHRIANPLAVHWDINTTRFDASDWNYAFVSDHMTEEEFDRKYPDAEKVDFMGDERDATQYWLDDDKIRVADYWRREPVEKKLLLLSTGETIREESFDDAAREMLFVQGITVTKERQVFGYKVMKRRISGVEVLETTEWPGEHIPICPVWGEEVIIDGRRWLRSMIRDARDSQMMFNLWRSATTELLALAPKAPFIGPKGFVPKDQKRKWSHANTRSYSYLEYEGNVPPQRQPFAGVPAGALQEALNAADDMKSVIGIYDSSLGARSNETSGKAILARQRESDNSNFHFIDNLARAIRYCGQCLTEIIPHIYTGRETLRIVGPDHKEKVVQMMKEGRTQEGEQKLYDLNTGRYDVTIKSGPSYSTQREETREFLIEIMRNMPDSAPYLGDILLEHMDFPNADKVAKRLKFALPPEVREAEAKEESANMPPEAQAAIAQLDKAVQDLKGQLGEAQKELASNQAEDKKLAVENRKVDLDELKLTNEADEMRLKRLAEPPKNFEEDMEQFAQAIAQMSQILIEAQATNQKQLAVIMDGLQRTLEAHSLPKRVVRDADGRAVGVETVTELETA